MVRARCNDVMKPHNATPVARRFSFGASAGLLLLVSACSTFRPVAEPGPAGGIDGAAAAIAASEPEADPIAPAGSARSMPPRRAPAKRVTSAKLRAGPGESSGDADREPAQPALQTLIDTVPEDAGDDRPPVAGPVPKLEPLADHANRSYRLRGRHYRPMKDLVPFRQRGIASWYGKQFHGRRTATGERYDMHEMSAAHPTLPLPSYVRVTNLKTGTSIIVRVNDRGPFAHNRVIDLSHAAAGRLGVLAGGIAAVEINLILPEPAGTGLTAPVAGVLD